MSRKPAVMDMWQFLFPSAVLFRQDGSSLCLETCLYLDFRAFDISFNFPFCEKDGVFQFNTAAGDLYNPVSEFYF